MLSLKWTWIMSITAVAVLAMACGGDTGAPVTEEKIKGLSAAGGQALTAEEAGGYVGLLAKICGTVAKTVHEPEHPRRPTFLYFDKAEDPAFFVYFPFPQLRQMGGWPDIDVYSGQMDPSFDLSGGWFDGKKICVDGPVTRYRNVPSMHVSRWNQFEFSEE